MPTPDMIPYDPLQGCTPAEESRSYDMDIPIGNTPYPHTRNIRNTHQFAEVSLRTKLIGCLFILPLYFYIFPRLLAYILAAVGIRASMPDDNSYLVLINLLHDLFFFIVLIFLFRKLLATYAKDLKKRPLRYFFADVGIGYAFFFCCNLLFSLPIAQLTGNEMSINQDIMIELTGFSPLPIFLMATFLAPVLEELIFRGIIFHTVRPLGAIPAILVSAAAFGFVHVMETVMAGDFHELIMAIPYMGMGIALGTIYERRRNILVNMLVHVLQNLFAFSMILLFRHLGIFR